MGVGEEMNARVECFWAERWRVREHGGGGGGRTRRRLREVERETEGGQGSSHSSQRGGEKTGRDRWTTYVRLGAVSIYCLNLFAFSSETLKKKKGNC